MLIEFIEDKSDSEETWKGYVYAVSMLVAATLQSLVLQQYFHIMTTLGMRIRSSVIGLLYEKVSINSGDSVTGVCLFYWENGTCVNETGNHKHNENETGI